MPITRHRFRFALSACLIAACGSGEITGGTAGYVDSADGIPTFREFEAATYREPMAAGVYIVNGDRPIPNTKQLREYYDALFYAALVVDQRNGSDSKWDQSRRLNLSYCISNAFGSSKSTVVAAMASAEEGWEQAADVRFVYDSSQDASCNASNSNVLFDVQPVSGAPYLARAFFPGQYRQTRNVMIDSTAFQSYWSLSSVLSHELGHVLGFRHEHTRPESGTCFEDNDWRPLTPYDAASIMHYPQCNGTGYSLTFSQSDYDGAAALYGAADGGQQEAPTEGVARSQTVSGTLDAGQMTAYQGIEVLSGTPMEIRMSGTGDADLYLRFGEEPSATAFDCRPYLDGSEESCALDVPADAGQAFIMVHGYTAASYQLELSWMEP